jgi:hypothetical protein
VEAHADAAVLRITLELMLDVRDGTCGVALVELERTVAFLATELGVAVEDGVSYGLDLPERFVPATRADAATFYFTLVELLGGCNNFGGHGAFLGAGVGAWWEALVLFYA